MATHTIPARSGIAVPLRASQTIRIFNTHGHQVIDTWAFTLPTTPSQNSIPSSSDKSAYPVEYMSMCHTRVALLALRPSVGSVLVSNRRRPMLRLTKDTSPGVHDMLMAACDIYRYQGLIPGLEANGGYHENCSDNLHFALKQLVSEVPSGETMELERMVNVLSGWTPDPLNLFMNVPWEEGPVGGVTYEPTVSKAGDLVELRAERDVVVVMSACPQDLVNINGGNPVDAHYVVLN